MFEAKGKYTTALFTTSEADEKCVGQVTQLINHPSFNQPVAIMPDCHAGKGCVIGFTMPISETVCPNIVGVDIGCGMLGTKYNKLNIDPKDLDKKIRQAIPFGQNVRTDNRNKYDLTEQDAGFWREVQSGLDSLWVRLKYRFGNGVPKPPTVNLEWYRKLCEKVGMNFDRAQKSIGSLGGGNHFIEVGNSRRPDPNPNAPEDSYIEYTWVVIHSGSRQLGKEICEYHQDKAKAQREKLTKGDYEDQIKFIRKNTPRTRDIPKKIKELRARLGLVTGVNTKGLETLEGAPMFEYLYDMVFAQYYASLSRGTMQAEIDKILGNPQKLEQIETIHNYISPEDLIIRKGAVASYAGQKLIIPFNMKDGIWICTGKSNADWNNSAPHGAGRILPRSKAKEQLDIKDVEKEMKEAGVYSSNIPLDEAPAAYKGTNLIKNLLNHTASVIEEVKPFLNMKA